VTCSHSSLNHHFPAIAEGAVLPMHKRCIFLFISFLSLLGILVLGFESVVFVSFIRILEIAALHGV